MNRKQVFNKVFLNEDQILDKMLKDAEAHKMGRKHLLRTLFHLAGIHFYDTKKNTDNHRAGKCNVCGKYAIGPEDGAIQVVLGLVGGITLAIIGIIAVWPPVGMITLIIGIICLILAYFCFRMGFTNLFWD